MYLIPLALIFSTTLTESANTGLAIGAFLPASAAVCQIHDKRILRIVGRGIADKPRMAGTIESRLSGSGFASDRNRRRVDAAERGAAWEGPGLPLRLWRL